MTTIDIDLTPRMHGGFARRSASPYSNPEETQLLFIYGLEMDAARRKRWDEAIARIRAWSVHPSELEDEGARAPTGGLLLCAIAVAETMRDRGAPAPGRVTPTNDGGLTFERWEGDVAEVLEFLPEGGGEMKTFYRDLLVRRAPLQFIGVSARIP